MVIKDDARLKRGLERGERAAFESWLDRDGPRVRALCLRMGASNHEADDLTQEIWIAAFQSVAAFRGESSLSTWIYRLAINHCLKWREKSGRSVPLAGEDAETLDVASPAENTLPPRELERGELRQYVRGALDSLSDGHRAVVVLHELHELTYAQCAEALQIPVGTVKSRLFNAFKSLRRELGPYVLSEELTEEAPTARFNSKPCRGDAS